MKVVFIQNVKNVAKKGEVKNVADGYFYNFLLPGKYAVVATATKMAQVDEAMKKAVIERERLISEAKAVQSKLNNVAVVLKAKSNNGKLYGSFNEKDIIDAIEKKTNIRLGKDNLKLKGSIKETGKFDIHVVLAEGYKATVNLEVKSE